MNPKESPSAPGRYPQFPGDPSHEAVQKALEKKVPAEKPVSEERSK